MSTTADGGALRRLARLIRGSASGSGDTAHAANPADAVRAVCADVACSAERAQQEQMLLGVVQLPQTAAREVMTPRRDIVALPVTATRAQTLALVAEEAPSRIPVYGAGLDDIRGILLLKDLFVRVTACPAPDTGFDLAALMREPFFVPESKRIGVLLGELQAKSAHMAIVVDEFGGTAGLITLEDVLEEIVGDIHDEHDVPQPEFERTAEGDVLIDGGVGLDMANQRLGLTLPEADYDTVGGFVFGELGRLPVAGDRVGLGGAGEMLVEVVDDRRVMRVRFRPPHTAVSVATGAAPIDLTGSDRVPVPG